MPGPLALAIESSGMVCAAGYNARSACAAIRAGVRFLRESHLYDPESGEFLAAGRVRLPHWWEGVGKLAELAAPAIHECLEGVDVDPTGVPVLLGVASPLRPARGGDLEDRILSEIAHRLGIRLHAESRVVSGGQVSGAVGVQIAADLLAAGEVERCVVAGVDSYVSHDAAAAYIGQHRLLTPVNSNGFTPGEAAAAVLLSANTRNRGRRFHIHGLGIAKDAATVDNDEPVTGLALTEAVRHALGQAGCSIEEIAYRITDLNGEHWKFKEASFGLMRIPRRPSPDLFELWHPMEYVGEIGAAIGPLVLAVAKHASEEGYAPGANVLCHFANDDGHRAALVAGEVD
jgi:3-oxoacyl-[acyl-carrier-protein] synthase-1